MRLVVKIGTSTIAYPSGGLNIRRMESICKVLSDLKNSGIEIILVTSGAIGMGVGKLGLSGRPDDMPTKQACAAVGQCELMYVYDRMFSEYNHTAGQILITGSLLKHLDRMENFTNTLNKLLEMGALPIINENDTIETEEIVIGDNDTLAAVVAVASGADLLVLLSDVDGLYSRNPNENKYAELIEVVNEITPEIEALAGGKGSALGTGGMITKIRAAQLCLENGCDMIITNGSKPELLYNIQEDKPFGTRFICK
ncbi:MAG: glutamate 5-kinase [Lachnospiraceae bacterium]|nr:glutamate 5-kinase [Lachnospiraceae bacterium]